MEIPSLHSGYYMVPLSLSLLKHIDTSQAVSNYYLEVLHAKPEDGD